MKFYVARQPIFNHKLQVYGYELLYRRAEADHFYNPPAQVDGDAASSNVIINSFYNIGIDEVTAGRKAFINFTGNFIAQEIATLFPKDILVVEVLEIVEQTEEVVARCKQLQALGYQIALDDFVLSEANRQLFDIADIIKIDLLATPLAEVIRVMRAAKRPTVRFLAEKIETREMYEQAVRLGFHLYQGYFFSKPTIVSGQELRPIPINCLRLIQIVNRSDFSYSQVSKIIMQDVSMSYQLLKLVNSAAFGRATRVKSIQHALVTLGTREVRKWVSLISMMGIGGHHPRELNRLSVIRAKFCEHVSGAMQRDDASDLFMLGLFSLIDVIMERDFETVFKDVAISEEIRQALLEGKGRYRPYLDLCIAYEQGDWAQVDAIASRMEIRAGIVADAYREAVRWCNGIFGLAA